MKRGLTAQIAVFSLAIAFAVAGCRTTPEPEEQMPEMTGERGGFRDDPGAIETTEVPERVPDLGTVYFDFDRFEIRDDQKPALKANARAILDNRGWGSVTLEGHCDERGSEEYNLALGERRANSARRYLVNLGVPASRIRTVSFGESTPAVRGHDESAWRWNRRVEFRVGR